MRAGIRYDGRLHTAAGLPADRKVLLYQGGLWAGRGLEDLQYIAPYLPKDWSMIVMGNGPFRKALEGVENLHLLDARSQNELTSWTAGASLGLIPYHDDNLNHRHCWPNKLWEYPAAGVPILSRSLPDISTKLEPAGFGVLVARDAKPEAFVDAVHQLSPNLLSELSDKATAFFSKDNWDIYRTVFIDVLHGGLNRPGNPGGNLVGVMQR